VILRETVPGPAVEQAHFRLPGSLWCSLCNHRTADCPSETCRWGHLRPRAGVRGSNRRRFRPEHDRGRAGAPGNRCGGPGPVVGIRPRMPDGCRPPGPCRISHPRRVRRGCRRRSSGGGKESPSSGLAKPRRAPSASGRNRIVTVPTCPRR